MILIGVTCPSVDVFCALPSATHRSAYARSRPARRIVQPQKVRSSSRHKWVKQHRLRCDCGQLAITVIRVRVGSDPQYSIHLPLCPACLILEQELHG